MGEHYQAELIPESRRRRLDLFSRSWPRTSAWSPLRLNGPNRTGVPPDQRRGAYWRGIRRTPSCQRITAPNGATRRKSKPIFIGSRKRKNANHRRIGKDSSSFTFSPDVARACRSGCRTACDPPGARILALQEERKDGYRRVATLTSRRMPVLRSRHLHYYKEDMYAPLDIDGEKYYLRR